MSTSTEVNTARVVRGAQPYRSEQGTVYAPGVSAETVASKVLFLGLVTLPPGERTKAHIHAHHESAFDLLSGDEVELWSGDRLERREAARRGDYLFIPANVPHVAVNRSKTEPAAFVQVTDPAKYKNCAEQVPAILRQFGGVFIVQGGRTEVLSGAAPMDRVSCQRSAPCHRGPTQQ